MVRPGVGDAAGDGLADPPRGVGGELEALAPVELLDGVHQAEVALLDEVEQRQAGGLVLLGDRDDEPQVRLDERALGVLAFARRAPQLALAGGGDVLAALRRCPRPRPCRPRSALARRTSSSLVSSGYCRCRSGRAGRDLLRLARRAPWPRRAPRKAQGRDPGTGRRVSGLGCFTIPAWSSPSTAGVRSTRPRGSMPAHRVVPSMAAIAVMPTTSS